MNSFHKVSALAFNQSQPVTEPNKTNVIKPNFKAGNDSFVRQQATQNQQALQRQRQIEDFQKEQKKQKLKQNISLGVGIFTAAAFAALVLAQFGVFKVKGAGAFSLSNMKFKNFKGDKSIASLKETKTLQPNVKEFYMDMLEASDIDPKYIKRAGVLYKTYPNAGLLLGPSGSGKTESVKMYAKERDAEFLLIKLGDFANSYVDGTATNMIKMFEELKALFDKNPNKRFVLLFDEADGIAKKLGNISADKDYLNKNRQSFLTGLDIILPCKNIEAFAATNVTLNQMDEAVISRFGKNVEFKLPNADQLVEGLKFHLRDCEGLGEFFTSKIDKVKEFANKMVERKYSFRDLEKMTTDAQMIYAKDMNTQKKDLEFSVDYLVKAMERKGKNSAELEQPMEEMGMSFEELVKLMLNSQKNK